jgi:hypothetical protein
VTHARYLTGVSRDTIHRFMAKSRYVGMVFKPWDEHDILRPQVAACPTRVSGQLDGFVALRTMIGLSGVLAAKRSLIRTTSSVHTGGEQKCLLPLSRVGPHIGELVLI